MSNSRWKPYSEIPDEGTFLVWAPARPDGRNPYTGNSNVAITTRRKNRIGQVIATIGGHFAFDLPTPHLYCKIDDLMEELPIMPED